MNKKQRGRKKAAWGVKRWRNGRTKDNKMMPENSIVTVRQWQIRVSGRISMFLQSNSANYSATTHTMLHTQSRGCRRITLRNSLSHSDAKKNCESCSELAGKSHNRLWQSWKLILSSVLHPQRVCSVGRGVSSAVWRWRLNTRMCVLACFSRDNGHWPWSVIFVKACEFNT